MRTLKTIGGIFLVLYSILILFVEYRSGQEAVRYYLTDIQGPRPFYAINTSLSALFLALTSFAFLLSARCLVGDKFSEKRRVFYISQFLIFAYLAIDERFMFHEHMGSLIGINGDYTIISLGIVEAVIFFTLGKFMELPKQNKLYLAFAASFFLIMVINDRLIPATVFWRLSIEDLSKMWSGLFLCLFAWKTLLDHIDALRNRSKDTATQRLS